MPNPTRSDVHVNQPLTQVSIAYLQNETKFIAAQCFPSLSVPKQSDLYFQYSQADFMRAEAAIRAPGTESKGAGYDLTTASYSAAVFALHKDVADQIRQNADAPTSHQEQNGMPAARLRSRISKRKLILLRLRQGLELTASFWESMPIMP